MPSGPIRPKVEWQTQFNLLMDLYDQGRTLDTQEKIAVITKFLSLSQPDAEKQIWGWFRKADRANSIVIVLRWGLNQYRDGKPFLRAGPVDDSTFGAFTAFVDTNKFQDGILWDRSRSQAVRVGSNDPVNLFLTRVFELLTKITPWLRVCQRDACLRLFLYQRPKQIYCSEQCAQRVRMERFLAQRGPTLSDERGRRRK
jgi:hypothetical protein